MTRNTTIRDRHRAILRRGHPACSICGEQIDMSLKYPHQMSFVVDHVIPLAHGGADTLDNKAPAHAGCNRQKSSKPHARIVKRSGALTQPPPT